MGVVKFECRDCRGNPDKPCTLYLHAPLGIYPQNCVMDRFNHSVKCRWEEVRQKSLEGVTVQTTNIQSDAILLLEECHKLLPACKSHPKHFGKCQCLHCRVEYYISQNCTRL